MDNDEVADRVWIIECARCKTRGLAYTEALDDALDGFKELGWQWAERKMCPDCSGEVRDGSTPRIVLGNTEALPAWLPSSAQELLRARRREAGYCDHGKVLGVCCS